MNIPTMITIKEASSQTGLSYEYIRKLCLMGKIVYVRAGRRKILVNMEKLVDFLNKGEPEAGV
ncbi:MAG: excisionase family DNA-binding protein [Lachnospiraceae bacterium]|jgi:excisionase family DNA binding protein|nr:excisionase family DNA-binding protein [Lachnospiraceae bacterium]